MKEQLHVATTKAVAERRSIQGKLDFFDPSSENQMELVVERENMKRAWRVVSANKGVAGVDGMEID